MAFLGSWTSLFVLLLLPCVCEGAFVIGSDECIGLEATCPALHLFAQVTSMALPYGSDQGPICQDLLLLMTCP